ncbi:UPF0602 protein C4orf47 [Caerostris darwini]|uniref:Cilia-and flagella-associated protein 96 n=1 Tax=Caerostris darwini TaxID=1538125 RepID=A0AAV4UQJ3_9ARAC|nr:UPF0602 protein C4orf47 [Caerostris darwini]
MDEEPVKTGPDFEKIGLFREMGYLEYTPTKIAFNEESKKGKQMMTNCTKSKTSAQDGYFEPTFNRVFEGEGYMDMIRLRRTRRLEQATKDLAETFIYANPPKKPCGSGSNYGTFTDYVKKLEYFSSHPAPVKAAPSPKKNFFTNPGKKGTGYGYPNVTIGKMPPYFLEEEYEELKAMDRAPKTHEDRPFLPYRAGLYPQEYFGPNPFKIDEGVLPPAEEPEKGEGEDAEKPVFRPTSPSKKDGGMKAGCLNTYPEHTAEPYAKIALDDRGAKHFANADNQMFRPVPGPKPYPVKSVISKNVQKKIENFGYCILQWIYVGIEGNNNTEKLARKARKPAHIPSIHATLNFNVEAKHMLKELQIQLKQQI